MSELIIHANMIIMLKPHVSSEYAKEILWDKKKYFNHILYKIKFKNVNLIEFILRNKIYFKKIQYRGK